MREDTQHLGYEGLSYFAYKMQNTYINKDEKEVTVATLVDGKVPTSQLPSYVDDVIEVASYQNLPTTGEVGKIYVTIDTNKTYRWSGSTYIEIAKTTIDTIKVNGTPLVPDQYKAVDISVPDAQIQSDWTEADNTKASFIQHKPTIPAAQVNSDWNASSGVAEILNKPVIPSVSTVSNYITIDGSGGGTDINTYVPVGCIQMYAGISAPTGWLLCTGSIIALNDYNNGEAITCLDSKYQALANLLKVYPYNFYQHKLRVWKIEQGVPYFATTYTGTNGGQITVTGWTPTISAATQFTEGTTVSGTGTVGKAICVPDMQQKFPLGAKDSGKIGKNGHNADSAGWDTDLGKSGGEDKNTLDVKEMPTHKHDLYVDNDSGTAQSGRYTINTAEETIYSKASDWNGSSGTQGTIPNIMFTTGGGNAHNNVPPFLALNFIIKY